MSFFGFEMKEPFTVVDGMFCMCVLKFDDRLPEL